ncbi:hypothetical protein ACHAWF_012542 [Thalassiosira exigua]
MARNHAPGEYAVAYNSRNHWAVLSQLYGSVWNEVILYCLFNVGLTLFDYYVLDDIFEARGVVITDKAHGISIFFVSFLVVSRANMALSRYNQARDNLCTLFIKARDFYTGIACQTKACQTQEAKTWRNDLAYYTCLLVRLCMASFDYADEEIEPWTIGELKGKIKEQILRDNQITGDTGKWAHKPRTTKEETYRVPNAMAFHLRLALHDQADFLDADMGVGPVNRFNGLLEGVMGAYNNQVKIITTPMPFPLVQMARTMMFMWVFTLPIAIESDSSTVLIHCVVVFLLTFAFMGLETVSLELDDPFGHDENDLDNLGLAEYCVFENIYAVVRKVDGEEWATRVRENMKADGKDVPVTEGTALLA